MNVYSQRTVLEPLVYRADGIPGKSEEQRNGMRPMPAGRAAVPISESSMPEAEGACLVELLSVCQKAVTPG
jgi:hypothetical protein